VRAMLRGESLYQALFSLRQYATVLHNLVETKSYDVIQCEYAYMGQYCIRLKQPWILDEHNVEFRINATIAGTNKGWEGFLYKVYSRREHSLRRKEERNACREAACVLAVSKVDRDLLLQEVPKADVTVVPNGVDLEYFRPRGRSTEDDCEAVFVGKMDY